MPKKLIHINATFQGVDDWSRCLIKTEKGTMLVDTECLPPEAIKQDPNSGHWHTICGEYGEPCAPIKSTIRITLTD